MWSNLKGRTNILWSFIQHILVSHSQNEEAGTGLILHLKQPINKYIWGTSLVVQWLRICLPMPGTWFWALVREDLTCCGATKPVRHNYWACALEPASHNYWSPHALEPTSHSYRACMLQILKPTCPRAHAPQQEKPPQWEACALQQRVVSACHS